VPNRDNATLRVRAEDDYAGALDVTLLASAVVDASATVRSTALDQRNWTLAFQVNR
jgi:hypothetical protein